MPKPNQLNKRRKRPYAAPVGGIYILLAVIGVITVIAASIRLTLNVLDNTSEKERFANLIRPVAMFDPPPFEDPASIKMEELLRYSMWSALKSDKRALYQQEGIVQELIVPASDLDVACARLFGPEIKLVHQSFATDIENRYDYNGNTEQYTVPIAVQLLVYEPVVEDVTKDGDFLNLHVGYVPPATAWTETGGPTPDKYMIYVMRRSGDSYLIAKVRDVPVPEGTPLEGRLHNK